MAIWLEVKTGEFTSDGKWTATVFYDESFAKESE